MVYNAAAFATYAAAAQLPNAAAAAAAAVAAAAASTSTSAASTMSGDAICDANVVCMSQSQYATSTLTAPAMTTGGYAPIATTRLLPMSMFSSGITAATGKLLESRKILSHPACSFRLAATKKSSRANDVQPRAARRARKPLLRVALSGRLYAREARRANLPPRIAHSGISSELANFASIDRFVRSGSKIVVQKSGSRSANVQSR